MDAFEEFRFKIGDLVYLRAEIVATEVYNNLARGTGRREALPLLIVERQHVEYHGGRQRLYCVRLFGSDATSQLNTITEIELIAHKKED